MKVLYQIETGNYIGNCSAESAEEAVLQMFVKQPPQNPGILTRVRAIFPKRTPDCRWKYISSEEIIRKIKLQSPPPSIKTKLK